MKKVLPKSILFCYLVLLCSLNAFAQKKITLEHNGTSAFFIDLPAAMAAAVSDDIIYLPGGSFPGFTLDKKLTIIGVGHNPDSTIVTDRTVITGDIVLLSGSSGGQIWGLYIIGRIDIASQNIVNGFRVSRCRISAVFCLIDAIVNDFVLTENIIYASPLCFGCTSTASINLTGNNITVLNDLILGATTVSNAHLSNNVFTAAFSFNTTYHFNNCLIENNVFNPVIPFYPHYGNNIYHNNLFEGVNGIDLYGNQGSGNIFPSTSFAEQFVSYSSSNEIYINDFHIVNAAYNTGGTNGTAIGIYGGGFPWKAGSLPFNPHINLKVIAPTTNNSGGLPVQIRARAQNN